MMQKVSFLPFIVTEKAMSKHSILLLISIGIISQPLAALDTNRLGPKDERQPAYNRRILDAYQQTLKQSEVDLADGSNGDIDNVENFAGSFTKLFQHDASTVVTAAGVAEYKKFLKAMTTGIQSQFNAVNLATNNERILVNPQASFTFSNMGSDTSLFTMPPAPNLSSSLAAGEMIEVYLMAICRDVRFEDYGTGANTDDNGSGGSITNDAAAVLNSLGSDYEGPRNALNMVDASVLFRGTTQGDLVGPYVSQFLLQPLYPLFPSGCAPFVAGLIGVGNLDQDVLANPQHIPIPNVREFGVSRSDFVAIQNGEIPQPYVLADYDQTTKAYPTKGRDMGSIVHTDSPYGPYYAALDILGYWNFPISPVFPYANGSITNEGAGITMGGPDAYALVGGAMLEALKAAWVQKWRVNLRLRPEAMAGLVDQVQETAANPYNLHPLLFATHAGIDVLQLMLEHNQAQSSIAGYTPDQLPTFADASTYLLAQMYPEGSPAHPSYPAGHATIAAACTTVIKAIFDDTAKLNTRLAPVKVDPTDPTELVELSGEGENDMTVGSELDKLASNITLARNFGGVHYRSDGDLGMILGEQVAIQFLQSRASEYTEQGFTGFQLTKRDGTRIQITATAINEI